MYGGLNEIAERAQRERRLAQLSDDNAFVDVNAVLQRGSGGGAESVSSFAGRPGTRTAAAAGSSAADVFLGERTFVLRKRQHPSGGAETEGYRKMAAVSAGATGTATTATMGVVPRTAVVLRRARPRHRRRRPRSRFISRRV